MEATLFLIKKIFISLFLPPGIFIVLLFLSGIFFFFRGRRVALSSFMIGLAMSLYLLSISPVKDALLLPLENSYQIPTHIRGDAIVLLGGGANSTAPDLTGKGAPAEDMMGRMVMAFRIHRKTNLPIIVAGGKSWRCKGRESPIVKRFLVDMGVSPEKIFMDTASRDTMENAIQVKIILEQIGSRQPILVTSAYHMKRAVLSFKKVGLRVIPFPSDFKASRGACRDWVAFLPKIGSLMGSYRALKEYFGLIYYMLL